MSKINKVKMSKVANQMELTEKEGIVIRNFLNNYHLQHINSKDKLSLKNQLELLYSYTFTLIK